jgi:hypothetical protein
VLESSNLYGNEKLIIIGYNKRTIGFNKFAFCEEIELVTQFHTI